MKIGFVGLGKMGGQIVAKLLADGHQVVGMDINPAIMSEYAQKGVTPAASREELVANLGEMPVLWLMLPANVVGAEVSAYLDLLPPGSILVDGGNSNYRETMLRAAEAGKKDIAYIDVGTSGGILGLEHGFCMMVGGDEAPVNRLSPVFDCLAWPRGRWARMGGLGTGHYVKMVHNGIEYGLMQAYAEGYDLLKYGEVRDLDLAVISHVWQGGSIVQSTLNQLIRDIMRENPEQDGVDGYVAESGEGRWTLQASEAANVPMPVLREAMCVRKASQNGYHTFATKLLASLRNKFGGHAINAK